MASPSANEDTPLLSATAPPSPEATKDARPSRPPRNVTFNPNPVTKTIEPEAAYPHARVSPQHRREAPATPTDGFYYGTGGLGGGAPVLSALNSKLRRRNSHGGGVPGGSAASGLPLVAPNGGPQPKVGPQRSTKNSQKLKLLPNPELEADVDDESGRDVYSQYTRIKDPTARRDAARLGKADRDRLPRVTAYCTANRYQMDALMRFLKGRGRTKGANPKRIDECIYTPYSYTFKHEGSARQERRLEVHSNPERRHSTGDLHDIPSESTQSSLGDGLPESQESVDDMLVEQMAEADTLASELADFDIHVHTPEVFLFAYGVVVIWGMSAAEEQRFLRELAKFELEKLKPEDVEAEKFNFYYTHEYQARIYNDFITLRDKNNYMTKLAISHALAQSVKTSLFEEIVASTIDTCKNIPTQLALTGKIALSRSEINMQIGELFILRISIHLNGSVLDTPELFWVEPQLEPVYQAVRSYLEMDQRVGLLTDRLDVIADLLAVLKEQLSHGHGEKLEWIVIILIAAEIFVALINIVVDLYVGVD
ncbi:208f0023-f26e-401d-b669-a3ddcc0a98ca [Thermothielavioides terrestris]|uniref:DUF155 domain-containing protein n=2 Tax=Thermothielavioides terrestris TaxID=2587410 RepID=G2RA90_THETT|nr:uncharacterized protein THITE_2118531 [Thermothielavioides terrestris NRRL 8126]AEO68822.1 hypothetical protein THITE_2118531 [Thermothielavioides terrestris NRRL 8126]SPQ22910.1 208f0023-f26e-401d-b669-a3ddcc0a98ca [Thermothielavioides terrestris]